MIATFDQFMMRKPSMMDAQRLLKISQNTEVMAYYGTPAFATLYEAIAEIKWFHTLEKTNQGFRYVITNLDNKCIGSLGCFSYNLDDLSVEISYQLDRDYWGKGIMTQALMKLLDVMEQTQKYECVIGYVHQQNSHSSRLLLRCGFVKVEHFVAKPEDARRLDQCDMYLRVF